MLFALIAIALIFDFTNGSNDASNIVATAIASGAVSPRLAMAITAICEFIAPFLFGVAVATTIGSDLIDPAVISLEVVFAAVLAAICWNLITRRLGIPSSSSHALVGGLLGAAILSQGISVVYFSGLLKIMAGLFFSPVVGLIFGYIFMRLILLLARDSSPRVNRIFKRLQILTLMSLALSHGSNDSQKTMGIITLGLVTAGIQQSFHVPLWVIAASAGAISLGTTFGGWRLIRTIGGRIYRIRPVNAFTSQFASAAVILSAAALGTPVSTTHVISSAVMGAGAGQRVNKVHWLVAQDMLLTWIMTIPLSGVFSALVYTLVMLLT
jgi:PiT family inorganic phosphate transporter